MGASCERVALPYLGHGHGSIMPTVNKEVRRALQIPHHDLFSRRINHLGQLGMLAQVSGGAPDRGRLRPN